VVGNGNCLDEDYYIVVVDFHRFGVDMVVDLDCLRDVDHKTTQILQTPSTQITIAH
jgi:hypothetical protein